MKAPDRKSRVAEIAELAAALEERILEDRDDLRSMALVRVLSKELQALYQETNP